MSKTSCNPLLCIQQPFFWNYHGWKLFLNVRQTTLGPLRTFQGSVRIEPGQATAGLPKVAEEIACSKHHSNCPDATLDAMDLAHGILTVINTALLTHDQSK
ncbi:MAG: hypothetical protein EOO38_19765 [Cytophagaceae bacterium]|nr:MAG: hypothetical protein EOO38_19765 [Cytophagaceae bacterium]